MYCEIIYQNIGERWGIFPRDIGEFQAMICNADGIIMGDSKDTIIKRSPKIELTTCSLTPEKKNKRHQKAFDDLVEKLLKTGWQPLTEKGEAWYNLRFYKNEM